MQNRAARRRIIGILSVFFIFTGFFIIPVAYGDFYKWKDEQGNWHFSDQPPAESQQDSWWDEKGDVIRTTKPDLETNSPDGNGPDEKSEKSKAANPGMLWKIKATGSASSYILGTIHSEDPRVLHFSPVMERTFKSADTFIMEVVIDDSDILGISTSMMFMDGRTLNSVIGDDLYVQAADAMQKYGVPEMILNQLKPWAVYAVLSVPKPQTGQFMDLILLKKARTQNKRVVGLETAQEQLAVFENLSMNDQIALLEDVLDQLPQIPQMLDQLVATYAAGDLEGVAKLAEKFMTAGSASGQMAADRLLKRANDDRNIRMVDRMLPYLLEGDAFIAVGVLHLPGKKGILNLLRQRGFKVAPAKPNSG